MPKIKLTDADVRGLRYARNVEGAPLRWLAETYGVSMAQVSRVTRGLQRRPVEVSSHEETPEVGKLLAHNFTTKGPSEEELRGEEGWKHKIIDSGKIECDGVEYEVGKRQVVAPEEDHDVFRGRILQQI